jgi:V/A-type H+/Na+-transporting ATPase subunit D
MNDLTPTRSLLIALGDERRTMREGYAFLDEKCLLLAGEMLREVRRHQGLMQRYAVLEKSARAALRGALARHGLNGLQVFPAAAAPRGVEVKPRALLGVALLDARWAATAGPQPPAVNPSPEAHACRVEYSRLTALLVEIAGVSTSLARLYAEYRRTVRRVRALQDVLLPELDQDIADIDTRLEDLEREDAVASRRHV